MAPILLHAPRPMTPHLLDRFALFYPMRLVGTWFMILVLSLYAWQFDGFDAYYYALVVVLVVYPHVVHHIARKYPQNRQNVEMRAFLLDSFVLGMAVHSTAFAPLPTFILITVALVNAIAVNGFRQMLFSSAALVGGIAAYALLAGINFAPKDAIAIDVMSSVFLLLYFTTFAYSSYNRNALLMQSQAELRAQKASLEIEKLRSDRLLFNLVPTRLAAEMARTGGIPPTLFESVTLVAIELRHFSRALQECDVQDVLSHLMHCFKAFDAIGDRRGLEKLKTMGDIYIAVAGLPVARPTDAIAGIETALDARDFLADLRESRRAHGKFQLDARIAVHSGSVIGGIVETSKRSYDVWGTSMKALLDLLPACADGRVVVSDAARRLAGDAFEWSSTTEGHGDGAHRVVYGAERRSRLVIPVHA
jgi:class 3 adenylate cyclase